MNPPLELADRVEAATGPDRELDVAVALAASVIRERAFNLCYATGNDSDYVLERGYYDLEGGPQELPRYTASLDAAMTLVPEGFAWSLFDGGWAGVEPSPGGDNIAAATKCGATAALALTAAALRSRASIQETGNG